MYIYDHDSTYLLSVACSEAYLHPYASVSTNNSVGNSSTHVMPELVIPTPLLVLAGVCGSSYWPTLNIMYAYLGKSYSGATQREYEHRGVEVVRGDLHLVPLERV